MMSLVKTSLRLVLTASLVGTAGCSMLPGTDNDTAANIDITESPNIHAANLSIARALEKQSDFKKASLLYQELLRQEPDAVPVLHRLAITEDKLGNHERAGELFRQAIDEEPENAVLLADYGYHLYLAERLDQAEPVLRKAVQLEPHNARAKVNLALVLCSQEQFTEGRKLFLEAGLSPRDIQLNMAFAHTASGHLKQGRAAYAQLRSERPGDDNLNARIAQIDEVIAEVAPARLQGVPIAEGQQPNMTIPAVVNAGQIERARFTDEVAGGSRIMTVSAIEPIGADVVDSSAVDYASTDYSPNNPFVSDRASR